MASGAPDPLLVVDHPSDYHATMQDSGQAVMGEPRRIALWQRLMDVAKGGIGKLHYWTAEDGLPVGTPGPAHQHTMPTLVLCLSGSIRVSGRSGLDLAAGDVLVVEPGCWHQHQPHKAGCSSFAIGFLAGKCDILFFDDQEELWGSVHHDPYRGIMDQLVETQDLPAAQRIGQRLPLIDQILAQVITDRSTFVDWLHPGVLAMAAHLWNHLHEPISADDIIAKSGMGRTSSYEMFRSFFGRTPQQELLSQRLDLARHMLRRSLSVTDAAARSGFPNRAELTRAYRRRFGHPPSADARTPG
jgi:AraC-like DNA-binding protein